MEPAAATAPVAATRRAASPTAGTVRTAMWEAVAATVQEVTALHLAREVHTAPAVQAAALPTADLDKAVTLDTTRAAAPVEASTTGALAALGSSIIRMEAMVSRFLWAASSKAERRRKAASTSRES